MHGYFTRTTTIYGLSVIDTAVMSKKEIGGIGDDYDNDWELLSFGGYTRIDVTTMSGSEYSAKFNVPSNHQFNRKRGIRACIGKIIKAMSN